jgi:hypothetical protein
MGNAVAAALEAEARNPCETRSFIHTKTLEPDVRVGEGMNRTS